jgi:hypothetical protein
LKVKKNHLDQAVLIIKRQLQYKVAEEKQKNILAVWIPFAQQAKVIRKYLKQLGIIKIVVGTVHVLQGSEFDVIVFSPTYTSNTDSHSFDREQYILNVATSRAKKSFLIFGDMRYFGINRNEVSRKLRNCSIDATSTVLIPEKEEVDHLLEAMKKDFYRELLGKTHQIYKVNIINSVFDQAQIGNNENATLHS